MPTLSAQHAFEAALQQHQAGRLREAEQLYRQILGQQPEHAGALHYLGLIAHQAGHSDEAVKLISRSLALMPGWAEAHSNLGNILQAKGQVAEAIAACRRAIVIKPNLAEAHNNLGNALTEKGDFDEAISACRQALALRPGYVEAQFNLGNALRAAGRLDEAIAAIALKRDYPEAFNNLGDALHAKGLAIDAIAAFTQALALRPGYPQAQNNLGRALQARGQLEDARTAYLKALAMDPRNADAASNLGNALTDLGQLDDAIAAFHQAIALKPAYFEAYSNLGVALQAKGRLDEAIAVCRKAVALNPDFTQGHYNLASALLMRGDFAEGWREYEWRWKLPDFKPPWRGIALPPWEGENLQGKTILVYTEQGLGDGFLAARFVPELASRGGKIVVVCHKSQIGLMRNLRGVADAMAWDHALPEADFFVPMISLPRVLGTARATIPAEVPYLHVDPVAVESWRQRLTEYPGFKIGLVWRGNPKPDPLRSCPLAGLAGLGSVPGTQFFSLQVGEGAVEAKTPPTGLNLIDFSADFVDFVETAACIVNLDLVITIDTAVAHLAGALGRPMWTMLPVSPDWRWMRDREDSPWYPTMRLFRQTARNDWSDVVARVEAELRARVANASI
jgi:tetratricopeptide (TPR) repeat protein